MYRLVKARALLWSILAPNRLSISIWGVHGVLTPHLARKALFWFHVLKLTSLWRAPWQKGPIQKLAVLKKTIQNTFFSSVWRQLPAATHGSGSSGCGQSAPLLLRSAPLLRYSPVLPCSLSGRRVTAAAPPPPLWAATSRDHWTQTGHRFWWTQWLLVLMVDPLVANTHGGSNGRLYSRWTHCLLILKVDLRIADIHGGPNGCKYSWWTQ